MSPGAQLACIDFIRFAGDLGSSMYFEQFLHHGLSACSDSIPCELPGLDNWEGIDALKHRLKRFAAAHPDSRVLLANRSSQLMKLAARLLFGPCRNVLTTDLTWQTYAKILRSNREAVGNRITCLPLHRRILRDTISASEVAQIVVDKFVKNKCDGLFLPAVDNLGIRFPVEQCVQAISSRCELRFVVVDGAQAIGHIPISLAKDYCDFYIAGCHKWLRAFHPMGLGFFGNDRSADYIEDAIERLLNCGAIDDPLLSFTEQARTNAVNPFGETVNLGVLFSCYGALLDTENPKQFPEGDLQSTNADAVLDAAHESGWHSIHPHASLQSRILLLEHPTLADRNESAEQIRHDFLRAGVALTAYDKGRVRISLPAQPWTSEQLGCLSRAFTSN